MDKVSVNRLRGKDEHPEDSRQPSREDCLWAFTSALDFLESVGPIVGIIEAIKIEWLVSNRDEESDSDKLDLICRFVFYTKHETLGGGKVEVLLGAQCVEVGETASKLRLSFKVALVLALGGMDILRQSLSDDIDAIPVEEEEA